MLSSIVTFFVDLMFCLTLCIYPIDFEINFGRGHWIASTNNPRNVPNKPSLIACKNVDTMGAPIHIRSYACRLEADFYWYTLFMLCCNCTIIGIGATLVCLDIIMKINISSLFLLDWVLFY